MTLASTTAAARARRTLTPATLALVAAALQRKESQMQKEALMTRASTVEQPSSMLRRKGLSAGTESSQPLISSGIRIRNL